MNTAVHGASNGVSLKVVSIYDTGSYVVKAIKLHNLLAGCKLTSLQEKIFFYLLERRSTAKGYTSLSQALIARDNKCSVRSVIRTVNKLRDYDFIQTENPSEISHIRYYITENLYNMINTARAGASDLQQAPCSAINNSGNQPVENSAKSLENEANLSQDYDNLSGGYDNLSHRYINKYNNILSKNKRNDFQTVQNSPSDEKLSQGQFENLENLQEEQSKHIRHAGKPANLLYTSQSGGGQTPAAPCWKGERYVKGLDTEFKKKLSPQEALKRVNKRAAKIFKNAETLYKWIDASDFRRKYRNTFVKFNRKALEDYLMCESQAACVNFLEKDFPAYLKRVEKSQLTAGA